MHLNLSKSYLQTKYSFNILFQHFLHANPKPLITFLTNMCIAVLRRPMCYNNCRGSYVVQVRHHRDKSNTNPKKPPTQDLKKQNNNNMILIRCVEQNNFYLPFPATPSCAPLHPCNRNIVSSRRCSLNSYIFNFSVLTKLHEGKFHVAHRSGNCVHFKISIFVFLYG